MKDFPGTALGGIGFYPILLTFGPVVTISSDTKMSCELACVSIVRIDSLLFHEILSMRRCFTEFHFALISPGMAVEIFGAYCIRAGVSADREHAPDLRLPC